jgi:hypothetical protein
MHKQRTTKGHGHNIGTHHFTDSDSQPIVRTQLCRFEAATIRGQGFWGFGDFLPDGGT